ncbi:MAG: ABC transporter substrate-binding protein [Anaerolineae bacterium]|nr:ABC transporter substrate-binding protein [Anaerolineae bacterium]
MKKISRFLSLFIVISILLIPMSALAQDDEPVIIRMNTSTGKGTHYNPLWWIGTGSQWHTFPWLFPGLMFYNESNEMILHLATDMQVNEDSTVYTYTLPEDAVWTDGEPLTSADVKFSYELFSNPAIQDIGATFGLGTSIADAGIVGYDAYASGEADGIEGIETPDDHTVVFNLEQPNGVFPRITYIYVMPEHILGDVAIEDLESHPFMDNPNVSSGPLIFNQYVVDEYLEFDVWKDGWWPVTPQFDKIIFFQSDQEASMNRLETGEEDLHVYGNPTQSERFADNPEIESIIVPGVGVQGLHVNQRQEMMQDLRVRQGIAYALDQDVIIDFQTEGNTTEIDSGIYGPDWAVSPDLEGYDYDPDKARSLFEEAGWDFDNNVIRFLSGDPDNDLLALYVQGALSEIGVQVELVSTAGGSILDIYNSGDYELGGIGGGSLAADPSVAAGYFTCNSTWGAWDGYCNERVDELAAEGVTYSTIEERAPIYQEMSLILNQDLPWIFLYKFPVTFQKNVRLQGFVPSAGLDNITWNLPEWYIES